MDILKVLNFDSMAKFFKSVQDYKAKGIVTLLVHEGKKDIQGVEGSISFVGSDCVLIEYKVLGGYELLPYSLIKKIRIEP